MTRPVFLLLGALALALPLSLLAGQVWISPFSPPVPNATAILMELRLPRAVLALVLGAKRLPPGQAPWNGTPG